MARFVFLFLALIFTFPSMAQKSQKECINIIKQSYQPFEVFLKKDNHLKYLEYKISTGYYNSSNKKQVQTSKVNIYSKANNSLAIFDKKEIYKNNGNIVVIDNNSKKIIIAKDTYNTMDNDELIKGFFLNRDTLFSCIINYNYEIVRIDSSTYHKITFYMNASEQKYQKIKEVQWIIATGSNNLHKMEMFYVKKAKYASTSFEVIKFETVSKRTNPFETDVLKDIYGPNGLKMKRYASYIIDDYTKQ